jgi:hypothetical protein
LPPAGAVVSTVVLFTQAVRKSKSSSKNSEAFVDYEARIEMKTRLKPVYRENQKQCAAALGLDVRELKEWKAENWPAFRFSRIYHAELLDWIAKRKKNIRRQAAAEPEQNALPKSHWDRERARMDFERAAFPLESEKRKYVLLDEICAAVGQMLAGFRTAINMLPGSAARWLIGLKRLSPDQEQTAKRSR